MSLVLFCFFFSNTHTQFYCSIVSTFTPKQCTLYIHFLTKNIEIDRFNTFLVLAGQQLPDHYSRQIYQSCNETNKQQHQQRGKVNDLANFKRPNEYFGCVSVLFDCDM